MFRQLDLRSWFTFLSRNRLYTAVNFVGLALALAFVLLVADYTVRQFTVDNYHTKADRIYAVCSEESVASGYYLRNICETAIPRSNRPVRWPSSKIRMRVRPRRDWPAEVPRLGTLRRHDLLPDVRLHAARRLARRGAGRP